MKKEHIVISALIVLFVIVGAAWIINFQPRPKQWVYVGSWQPQNYAEEAWKDVNVTTEQFVIGGEEWRVSWNCRQLYGGSHFDIVVYDAYTDNVVKEISTTIDETLSGESYLSAKGRFYLKIFVRGTLKDWRVSVSEYK